MFSGSEEVSPAHSNNDCEDEWSGIETREIQWACDSNISDNKTHVENVTDSDMWEHFKSIDLREYHVHVTFQPNRGHPFSLRYYFGRPPKLLKSLIQDGRLICCIAQCNFDDGIMLHVNALKSLYRYITGTSFDCPRVGPHWEDIGFQGSDPANDLRGVGLLGLYQALHLASNTRCRPLLNSIYSLSRDPKQEFPMMVLSINVTRIALQALKDGTLNRDSNARENICQVFNNFYVALMYHIWKIWKLEKKTIKDAGYVLKDAEAFGRKHTQRLLKNAEQYISEPFIS